MGFATPWLDKRALFPAFIEEDPDKNTGIIIVIPAFNEPEITNLLDSLALCDKPECNAEVIIVVNAPADAPDEYLQTNLQCTDNISSWKKKNSRCFFRLFVFNAGQPPIKGWGVGLARKTGMDEALRRYDSINKPEGVIVSLDADCTVERNYFTAICENLLKDNHRSACSIYFEHPLTEKNIIEYELHLRYLLQAIVWTGFPYAFHTVGSAIAVKAISYVKAGGMNRKQAGEDFYFIQKLVQQGGYFALNSTVVYPSSRESSRVPFGTGPMMTRMMDNSFGSLTTYNIDAFKDLKQLFGIVLSEKNYNQLPQGIKSFIPENEWVSKMEEIENNTNSEESFRKRFFGWFNMFKIVKFLNFVHIDIYEKQPVAASSAALISLTGLNFRSENPGELLLFFRKIERN